MEWAVRIIGDVFDLDQFAKSLNNPVARIELDREGTYLLKSELFDGLLISCTSAIGFVQFSHLVKGTFYIE